MQRVALGVAYHGQHYFGWQRQTYPDKPTVQDCLEFALSSVAGHGIKIHTVCAGRTDKGVHAIGQVAHFDTPIQRTQRAWIEGTNSYLPNDIAVQWSVFVPNDFHARFTAIQRCYRYTLYNHSVPSPLWRELMTWFPHALDSEAMHCAAQHLIGEHDFSSFRASHCQSKTSWRHISAISVQRDQQHPHCIHIDVSANAFLYHMVRNIVGTLLIIGQKKKPIDWAKTVLEACDRQIAGQTAPPQGLYLTKVIYPPSYHQSFPISKYV